MAEQHSAQPGESWASRARSVDDLVEVVVVHPIRCDEPAATLLKARPAIVVGDPSANGKIGRSR